MIREPPRFKEAIEVLASNERWVTSSSVFLDSRL